MNSQIIKVSFDGDELEAVREGDKLWVVLRRICEVLGIHSSPQAAKLKGLAWACTTIIVSHDTTGRMQESLCLDLESLPMWLATINAGKVALQLRDKLVRYQRECARVLHDHFFGRVTSSGVSMDQIAVMIREELARALPAHLSPPGSDGVIGREEGNKIKADLMNIAILDADGNVRAARGRRTKHDNELRSSLQFFGSCRSWDMLPRDKLGSVRVLLEEIRKRVRDEAGRRDQARQGTLFPLQ